MARNVDIDELIDTAEVSELVGLSNPNGVSVYARRYSDFPAPVVVKGRCRLWVASEVRSWAARRSA